MLYKAILNSTDIRMLDSTVENGPLDLRPTKIVLMNGLIIRKDMNYCLIRLLSRYDIFQDHD